MKEKPEHDLIQPICPWCESWPCLCEREMPCVCGGTIKARTDIAGAVRAHQQTVPHRNWRADNDL